MRFVVRDFYTKVGHNLSVFGCNKVIEYDHVITKNPVSYEHGFTPYWVSHIVGYLDHKMMAQGECCSR